MHCFHRLVISTLLSGCAVLTINGAVFVQERTDVKVDDEKAKLNKALNVAAAIGRLDQVKELMKKGADPTWRDPAGNGKTAMVRAVMSGNLQVVTFLIESGVDVHAPDGSGRYPVYFMCIGSNVELLRYLLANGCDKDLNRGPFPMLVSVCDHGQANPEFIPILVKAGVDPNEFNRTVTPLIASLQLNPKVRKPEIVHAYVKALIECKADVTLRDKKEMLTPLQWANRRGDPVIVEMLKKAGASE